MSAEPPQTHDAALDPAAACVRAFVLYSLAEFQAGRATAVRVVLQGREFSIWDDGRGHPLDKSLEGTAYLRFIYTHFDYPFGQDRGAAVQLQGIGMSLVNALCEQLQVEVRKPDETLQLRFENGRAAASRRVASCNVETGMAVSARLRSGLPVDGAGPAALEAWLTGVQRVHPTLRLLFNGRPLQPPGP